MAEIVVALICPLTPTPPVTTSVPLPVVVLEVLAVNVVALFDVSVVNAPEAALVAPIVAQLIAVLPLLEPIDIDGVVPAVKVNRLTYAGPVSVS